MNNLEGSKYQISIIRGVKTKLKHDRELCIGISER